MKCRTLSCIVIGFTVGNIGKIGVTKKHLTKIIPHEKMYMNLLFPTITLTIRVHLKNSKDT